MVGPSSKSEASEANGDGGACVCVCGGGGGGRLEVTNYEAMFEHFPAPLPTQANRTTP